MPIPFKAAIAAVTAVLAAAFPVPAVPAGAATTGYYHLIQYPDAGFSGLYSQIKAAHHSIDMEMYELKDTTAEADLAAAAGRGVDVRVLLDRAFSGERENASTYSYLQRHGVHVKWAPGGYIFHIKATTFDGHTTDISTANLTSEYYADTRDATVIDTDQQQVKAIERTFANDWASAPGGDPNGQTVQAPGLVWSPNTGGGTGEDAMLAQIKRAKRSIAFESEELSDARVYDALAAAARRGVNCRIVMTEDSEWTAGLEAVTRAGCKVHVYPDSESALYIHEKLILDDAGSARQSLLIGSQNAGEESLTRNRELGVELTNADGGASAINAVAMTFAKDFAGAGRSS